MLRLASPWLRWLYWIVLGLALVGLGLAFSARVDETVSGPAQINGRIGTFLAVLPAAGGSALEEDSSLRVEVGTPTGRRGVAARALFVETADDEEVHRAGFDGFPQPAILVSGVLTPQPSDLAGSTSSPHEGRAVVVLRSERAVTVLLRGFQQGGDT